MTEKKKEENPAKGIQIPSNLELLKKFYSMGLTLIPVDPKTKKPYEKYGLWKENIPDFPTLSGMAAEHPEANWAVYCVSGVVGLDFDCPRTYEEYFMSLETLTTKSPSGGFHPILKSLVQVKPFENLGVEIKINELITVIGDGYEIVKDLPIKEIEDVAEFIKKSLPKFRAPRKKYSRLLKDVKVGDVVANYCKKVDGGHNYWRTYCPFHGDDKTPHLYVYENTNQWHCFKCKKHGYPIGFVREIENIEDGEALEKIEELLGISLRNEAKKYSESQAGTLIKYVENNNVELFHDNLEDPHIRVKQGEHWKIFPVNNKSRGFKRWLAQQYYKETGSAPNTEALMGAISVIEAKACFEGKKYTLHNRVCWHDNAIWYDLGTGEAVRITANGWQIIKDPPILFKSYRHQKPHEQAKITEEGDAKKVLIFVNLKDDGLKILFIVSLISCFIPDIPHIVFIVHGVKGAAKSTFLKIIKELVDPSEVQILSFPRDKVELIQMLSHHYVSPFDNVTSLSEWQSDSLCRASTGEGNSKRELFTDDEDFIYSYRRCVGLNGINVVATKPDLLDRSILIELTQIPKKERKSESAFWQSFNELKGEILSGIFSVISKAMAIKPQIRLKELPRMADFAEWGCAIAEVLEYGQDAFLGAYYANMQEQNREALESSPIGEMVILFMEDRPLWEGKSSELLSELEKLAEANKINLKQKGWPKAPHSLSRRLNDIKTNLLDEGIIFEKSRDENKRTLILRKISANSVSSDIPSGTQAGDSKKDDATTKTNCQNIDIIASAEENRPVPDATLKTPDTLESGIVSSQKCNAGMTADATDSNDATCRMFLEEVDKAAKEWEQMQKKSITQVNIVQATFSLKPQFPNIRTDDLAKYLRRYARIPQPDNTSNPLETQAEPKPVTTVQVAGETYEVYVE